jgi:oxysterol-binding protein 1
LKALFKAVHKQKLKEIQEILKNPRCSLIDFNSPNSYGETILHVAARTENEEIIRLCLKLGVDPFMKNRKGKIAIELARNPNTRALLKEGNQKLSVNILYNLFLAPMIRSKEILLNVSGTRMEGYLSKYTNFAGGFRRRWFVLENGVFSYFNNPSEYPISCRGSINLDYVDIVPSTSNPCKFDLVGVTKSEVKIHLKADAQDEAKRWIIALKQAKEFFSTLEPENEKIPPTNLLNVMNTPEIQNCKSPTFSSSPASPTWSSEIELAFMTLLRQEYLIHDPSSNRAQLMDNINNLKDILGRIEQLLTQKNRRLEAQRKEKDLLEDAVRSLALENNKWQTWARGQLSRNDPSSTTRVNSPKPERDQVVDVLTSLENQLESTMDSKVGDEDEEFYDVYEEGSDSDSDNAAESEKGAESDKSLDSVIIDSAHMIPSHQILTDKYGYPLNLRNSIPVDSTKMPAISLWNILKNAIRQQDLTRMPIPINFSEPLSMLQRMCEDLEYFELLETATSLKDDPAKRLVYIAAFAVTSYSGTDKRISKPFNPLLGETFELIAPKFKYLSEQVSHHPPIGASYCQADGYEYWNEVHVTSRFRGKYLELKPEGLSHIKFNDNNTHYSWNRVNTAVNNIIVGKIYLEHYGKMRIQSHGDDGLIAEINFIPNGWRKGTANRIEGKVFDTKSAKIHYTISGTWNQSITAKNELNSESFQVWNRNPSPPDSEVMYNFSSFAMTLNELTPKLKSLICPTDSRLRPDQRAMEEGEFDSASKLKVKLEEKQRKARKSHESDPYFVYNPRWFKRGIERDTGEEHWQYTGEYWENRKLNQWNNVPSIYL